MYFLRCLLSFLFGPSNDVRLARCDSYITSFELYCYARQLSQKPLMQCALEKMLFFADSPEQLSALQRRADCRSEIETRARIKLDAVLLRLLAEETNLKELSRLRGMVCRHGVAYTYATTKIEELTSRLFERATTLEGCLALRDYASLEVVKKIDQRINEFLLAKVKVSTSIEECLEIFDREDSGLKTAAGIRIDELLKEFANSSRRPARGFTVVKM